MEAQDSSKVLDIGSSPIGPADLKSKSHERD